MDGREAVAPDGIDVLLRGVPLGFGEPVAGVGAFEIVHEGVARDLGHDRRRGDGGDARIPLDNAALARMHVDGVPVDEDAVGVDARRLDSPCHGKPQGDRHAPAVNLLGRDVADAERDGVLADAHGELFAPFGRELLGIVQSEDDRLVGKGDGAYGERPRDGTASHLVHSEDDYNMALEASNILFGKATKESLLKLDERTLLDVFAGVPHYEVARDQVLGARAVDLLAETTKCFASKGEMRKLTQGGGVSINKEKLAQFDRPIESEDLIDGRYIIVQRGKKNYSLIIVK